MAIGAQLSAVSRIGSRAGGPVGRVQHAAPWASVALACLVLAAGCAEFREYHENPTPENFERAAAAQVQLLDTFNLLGIRDAKGNVRPERADYYDY